jgi:nucleoid-associated protein YgaU
MYQNSIKELPRLKTENLENIFHIYQNENDLYFYNLLQTIHFPQNLPDSYFQQYNVTYGDTWPYISYKVYGDTRLWWIITLANNIINPTHVLNSGDILKIPNIEVVSEILTQITTADE